MPFIFARCLVESAPCAPRSSTTGGAASGEGALISKKRSRAKSPPTGGRESSSASGAPALTLPQQLAEAAHQQQAFQPQPPTTGGRESSSAGGAPAPKLQPQGARELISRRRSSAKSPTTGGREELNSSRGNELYTHTRGGEGQPDLRHICPGFVGPPLPPGRMVMVPPWGFNGFPPLGVERSRSRS